MACTRTKYVTHTLIHTCDLQTERKYSIINATFKYLHSKLSFKHYSASTIKGNTKLYWAFVFIRCSSSEHLQFIPPVAYFCTKYSNLAWSSESKYDMQVLLRLGQKCGLKNVNMAFLVIRLYDLMLTLHNLDLNLTLIYTNICFIEDSKLLA